MNLPQELRTERLYLRRTREIRTVSPRRLLVWAANTLAGVVLILMAFDPTRDLRPVLVLPAAAVALWLAGGLWPRGRGQP